MKIAVHQMCSGTDAQANLQTMVAGIAHAANEGAGFYFAPEMSLLLDRNRERAAFAIVAEADNPAIAVLSRTAAEHGIWVHMGSVAVRLPGGSLYANRTLIFGPDGAVHARYDKIHLFDVDLSTGESWRESNAYAPGPGPICVETPLGLTGLAICYDMRFPDLFSAYAKAQVSAIAVPAAFTVPTGRAHWHILLRARAIEAEAFVIAAAQSGRHEDGRETFGHSLVVDPWGTVLLDMKEGEGIGFAEIDLNRIAEVRAQIPVHANRRNIGAI